MGLSRFAVDNDNTVRLRITNFVRACCTARLHSPMNTARKREGIREWNWSLQTTAGWHMRSRISMVAREAVHAKYCIVPHRLVGGSWRRGGARQRFPGQERAANVSCELFAVGLQWVCTLFVQCAVAGYAQLRTGTARCSQRCKGHVRDMAAPASRTSHSVMAGGCALGSLPRSNRVGSWRTDDEIKPGPVAPEAKDPSRDLRLCPTASHHISLVWFAVCRCP